MAHRVLVARIAFVCAAIPAIAATAFARDPAPGMARAMAPADARNEAPLESLALKNAEILFAARNRELLNARRAVEAAEAQTVAAGARPNPQLSFGSTGINPSRGIGPGKYADKSIDSTVRVDQVFERGGKRELRIAGARNLEIASREDLAAAERSQRIQLHAAYYDLLLAQERVQITAETTKLFDATMRAAELRLKTGDVAAADVARIHIDALRAQNDARQAEADRVRAQSMLAYMIGAESEAGRLRVTGNWRGAADSLSGTQARLDEFIARRPDVRAAQARVAAAQASRDLAKSLRTRDVSVGLQYERFPPDSSNTYGFGVSIPLFLNYNFEGEIRRAEVDLYSAQDDLERVRAQARGEAGRTLSDARAAQERVERYRGSLLAEAGRAADAAEFAYKNGALGVMDLLDARRVLRAIQVDAATAQADFAKALSAWEIATGSAP